MKVRRSTPPPPPPPKKKEKKEHSDPWKHCASPELALKTSSSNIITQAGATRFATTVEELHNQSSVFLFHSLLPYCMLTWRQTLW